jgi:hypothetical protein
MRVPKGLAAPLAIPGGRMPIAPCFLCHCFKQRFYDPAHDGDGTSGRGTLVGADGMRVPKGLAAPLAIPGFKTRTLSGSICVHFFAGWPMASGRGFAMIRMRRTDRRAAIFRARRLRRYFFS